MLKSLCPYLNREKEGIFGWEFPKEGKIEHIGRIQHRAYTYREHEIAYI